MHSSRQKIFFGACILAGVGLAVLIALANPPSPLQLALTAIRAFGVSEKSETSSPKALAQTPLAGIENPSGAPRGRGGVSPSGRATGTSAAQSEPPSHHCADPQAPSDSCSQPSGSEPPGLGSQIGTLGGNEACLWRPERQGHGPGPLLAEVLVPVAMRKVAQVPSSSGQPGGSEQSGAAERGSVAQGASSENPSAQQPTEEVPRQLLELWRQMRSGQGAGASSDGASMEQAPPTSLREGGGEANASTAPSPIPTQAASPAANEETSQSTDSSASEPSANRLGKLRPLSKSSGQTTRNLFSDSAPAASATAQLIQEGDGQLIINIRNEDIRKVLEMLSEQGNLNILATSSVQGKISATLTGVDLDSALQAILRSAGYVARREGKFIYVGTPEDFLRMEQAADRIGTRVYRPNYVKASDLKDLIQPLLTEKVGLVSVTAPADIGIASDDDKAGGNSFAGAETVLVRDYESVLAQIDQVVAEIDVRPMQVHIQAMILSVRLDDTDKFGVDFKKLINNSNFTIGWGTPVESLSQVTFTQGGLKFGFIDGDVGAFLEALESVADANVIAAPRLMVLNKHRADILIGRQEGYVNTTQTETATTQTVQFLDIGTQLRIRPFISPDGLIRMEIHPELSDGTVTIQGNFTLPQKDVTKVTTNIMVRDGCTVVIGGLMQEQATSSINQIPFFGNLPLVGVLFRRKTEEVKRVEIIVLVTPHIVREPEAYGEGALQQWEFQRRQKVYVEKMSPLGKRSVARRYVRMARQAWNQGDLDRALRFAEMAVHFDPLNREALEIRAQIWQSISAGPLPEEALSLPEEDWTKPIDGPTLAPWVLQELEKPSTEKPVPETPLPEIPPAPEPGKPPPPEQSGGRFPDGSAMGPASQDGQRNSGAQRELSGRSPPARQEEGRFKVIRRPSLFQQEPLRFP